MAGLATIRVPRVVRDRLRDAAKAVSESLGVPKPRVYDLGLALKRERAEQGGRTE